MDRQAIRLSQYLPRADAANCLMLSLVRHPRRIGCRVEKILGGFGQFSLLQALINNQPSAGKMGLSFGRSLAAIAERLAHSPIILRPPDLGNSTHKARSCPIQGP